MSGNRVWETSTTTGASDLTLLGAETNFQTFNNAKGVGPRFNYAIIDDTNSVWEIGVGRLSGSTTLVREEVTDNSSGTKVALVLSAGTKDVQITASVDNVVQPSTGFSTLGSRAKFVRSESAIRPNATQTVTANRIHWTGFRTTRPLTIDTLAAPITTGNGTGSNKIHLGIYDTDPNTGDPGAKLASVVDLDPSSSGLVSGTFTEMTISPGVYWLAFWSDAAPSIRANDGAITGSAASSVPNDTTVNNVSYLYINGQTSLTDLPAVGNANNSTSSLSWMLLLVGHS